MSLAVRSFVDFLIKEIQKEGILGKGYSDEEREYDVTQQIWKAYEKWDSE